MKYHYGCTSQQKINYFERIGMFTGPVSVSCYVLDSDKNDAGHSPDVEYD